jgi:hypothetical protein
MPYIQRSAQGEVVALTKTGDSSSEQLPSDHPDVIRFLAGASTGSGDNSSIEMLLSDLKLIRAIEDIIDLLIAKNVIIFSDLPPAVQQKILAKRGEREKLFGRNSGLLNPDEGIL